ncbi:hypothetical protein BWQ96_00532 [Gracilariopsis chorda]|uniref:Uncharacterized protein n=1 Tax=Gracilariopsis chorda TaxID=448386 RepID=A0A2V3J5K3_9FLOR|nr:hypothetical protein BWQ96_00532 [Gracilariopsis chorda]|eukprot:PXF49654.1 hypothetical protein BWQ96_00532 [Gracilariopsis chorda]
MVTKVETVSILEPTQDLENNPSTPSSVSGSTKRKKKRRNGQSGNTPDLSSGSASPAPSEAPSQEDLVHSETPARTMEQWKHRAQSLRSSLNQVQNENRVLSTDLKAAVARANDAEQAEAAVNKGLLSARSVISQRDRSIAELNAMVSNQRADLRRLEDEKKKLDRRLILLKTVSANLQEAREGRDAAEKRLEESNSNASQLRKKVAKAEERIEALNKHVEALDMTKKQVEKLHCQIHDLHDEKELSEQKATRNVVLAASAGAVGGAVVTLALSLLSRPNDEKDQ